MASWLPIVLWLLGASQCEIKLFGETKHMKNLMKRLWNEEEGQDLVEYGLLLVLVALVAITAMSTIGKTISNVFTNAATNLSSAS